MPLYEFQCSACQKIHEVMQKFSDAPLAECPDCKGPVTKMISLGSFALKGHGWYTTDYKRAGRKDESASVAKNETAAPAKVEVPKTAAPSSSPAKTT